MPDDNGSLQEVYTLFQFLSISSSPNFQIATGPLHEVRRDQKALPEEREILRLDNAVWLG